MLSNLRGNKALPEIEQHNLIRTRQNSLLEKNKVKRGGKRHSGEVASCSFLQNLFIINL